jgi:Superinfection immunity protein
MNTMMIALLVGVAVIAPVCLAGGMTIQDTVAGITTLLVMLFLVAMAVLAYLTPTLIARRRQLDEGIGLLLGLNLTLGWTGLGWLICLAWACFAKTKTEADFFRMSVKLMEDKHTAAIQQWMQRPQ